MPAPTVFLSFASEDAPWKNNFVSRDWFGDNLGPVEVLDYQLGSNLPFGSLNEWLSHTIGSAAVFIAFISKFYVEKQYPIREWCLGLSEAARRDLLFVPILLDGSAKQWWTDLKRQGELRDLGEDYAYSDFTDGNGRPAEIIVPGGSVDKVTRRIGELARLIREHLQKHSAIDVGAIDSEERLSIAVLGHPSAVSDPGVASSAHSLVKSLCDRGHRPIQWGDRWRLSAAARDLPPGFSVGNAIFVQPIGPGDAGDLAQSPERLSTWIRQGLEPGTANGAPGRKEFTTVLWLPPGMSDETFAAATPSALARNAFFLRTDDPETLASWLKAQSNDAQLPKVPILTLEEVDRNDAGRLRTALHRGFRAVVGDVIQPPPEAWTFKGEMLARQISELPGDRAIIAVHDLNTGISRGQKQARTQLEQKLGAVAWGVKQAVKTSGRKDLKLFWSALIVQKAEYLPWVKYPSPSQFEEWCLLPFAAPQENEGAGPIVRPKSAETDVFRSYLRDWLNQPIPCGSGS
jgi:hypothetical protein